MEEQVEKAETITISKRTLLFSILFPVVFALGLGSGYLLWGRNNSRVIVAEQPTPEVTFSDNVIRYDVPTDGDPSLGPDNAPITIIEFSDYECPYCQKWHLEVFKRLLAEYPDQVRFVFRDFPITSIHSNAVAAAEAANCAGEQGAYWQFNDALFSMKYGLGPNAYQTYAQELGLELAAFDECVQSRRHQQEVMDDFKYASELGVSSTPTFFINGLALIGAQPYEIFKQIIDKELAGEIPK